MEDRGFKRFEKDFLFGKIKDILYRMFVDPEAVDIQMFRSRLQNQRYFGEKETRIDIEPGAFSPFDFPIGLEIKVSEGRISYPPKDYNRLVEEEFKEACSLIRGYVLSQKRKGGIFEGP